MIPFREERGPRCPVCRAVLNRCPTRVWTTARAPEPDHVHRFPQGLTGGVVVCEGRPPCPGCVPAIPTGRRKNTLGHRIVVGAALELGPGWELHEIGALQARRCRAHYGTPGLPVGFGVHLIYLRRRTADAALEGPPRSRP